MHCTAGSRRADRVCGSTGTWHITTFLVTNGYGDSSHVPGCDKWHKATSLQARVASPFTAVRMALEVGASAKPLDNFDSEDDNSICDSLSISQLATCKRMLTKCSTKEERSSLNCCFLWMMSNVSQQVHETITTDSQPLVAV